jgi:hypothetical protein
MRTSDSIKAETGRRPEIEITPDMIEAGAEAGWGERFPPQISRDLAARIYRAMELKRRETELARSAE